MINAMTSVEEENFLFPNIINTNIEINSFFSEVAEIDTLMSSNNSTNYFKGLRDNSSRYDRDTKFKETKLHPMYLSEKREYEEIYTNCLVKSSRIILDMVNRTNSRNLLVSQTPRLVFHGPLSWLPSSMIEFMQKHASAAQSLLQKLCSDVSIQWLRFPQYMCKLKEGAKYFPGKFLHSLFGKMENSCMIFLLVCCAVPDFTHYNPNRSVILRNTNCISAAITEFPREAISSFGNMNMGNPVQVTCHEMREVTIVPNWQTNSAHRNIGAFLYQNVEHNLRQKHRSNNGKQNQEKKENDASGKNSELGEKREEIDRMDDHGADIQFSRITNASKHRTQGIPQISAQIANLDTGIGTMPFNMTDDQIQVRVIFKQDEKDLVNHHLTVQRTASVFEVLRVTDNFVKETLVTGSSPFTIYMEIQPDNFIPMETITTRSDILQQPISNTSRCFAVTSP